MADKRPVFDYAVCMACAMCEQVCPISCIEMSKSGIDSYQKIYPLLLTTPKCTGCALCAKICPVEAIAMQAG